ncbi:mutator family transposase [Pseudomonas sp. SJZ079]|nr:mutator family transposase [Pseudomonas sp. SJZ079]
MSTLPGVLALPILGVAADSRAPATASSRYSAEEQEARTLLDKAVVYYQQEGDQALATFSREGPFTVGNLYVFVVDREGTLVASRGPCLMLLGQDVAWLSAKWIAQNEGAKFWLQVVTELRNRGVQDIFVACVDGLKGFPKAIEAVFPHTSVQLCIVHMVRHSLNYVSWKRRAEVAADLKRIYQSSTADEAELRLGEFEAKWDDDYLPIGQSWRRNWARITPFFDFPPEIRKVIYTTNALESVNMSLRKITKNRGSFPSDEALLKLFYLALRNISKKWTMPIRDWKAALTRFTISYEDRLPQQ